MSSLQFVQKNFQLLLRTLLIRKNCLNFNLKRQLNNPCKKGTSQQFATYQEMVYKNYFLQQDYWQDITNKLNREPLSYSEQERIKEFLSLSSHSEFPSSAKDVNTILPYYIATMQNNKTVSICDNYCCELFDARFESANAKKLSSFEFIHAWLNYFHPNFTSVNRLQCFDQLLQRRCVEIVNTENNNLKDNLVHLIFFAGMGKKSFQSHEVLSQIATFCDNNPDITFAVLDIFELAIISESFFKGGIRFISEAPLNIISSKLCSYLSRALQHQSNQDEYFEFVTISLLKILRQVNHIDQRLLELLGKIMLSSVYKEKVLHIRFITNIISAFSGPGRKQLLPQDPNAELSLQNILRRMESLVVSILKEEQSTQREDSSSSSSSEPGVAMKSRLKDISRFLWTTAALGYQMSSEIYIKELSRRFDKGQFSFKPEDAIDALLALSIMNQHPDPIVLKILKSVQFQTDVKLNCSNRHKGRLGLFLMAIRIERNSIWKQLSRAEELEWFQTVRTPFTVTDSDAWSPFPKPVKPLELPAIERDFKPHTQLLNMCLDALNQIVAKRSANYDNEITNHHEYNRPLRRPSKRKVIPRVPNQIDTLQQSQVLIGYAVPFLFIPGILINSPNMRTELYIEVLDEIGLSLSYHSFKMRLMEKTRCNLVKISREDIQHLDQKELMSYLEPILVGYLVKRTSAY